MRLRPCPVVFDRFSFGWHTGLRTGPSLRLDAADRPFFSYINVMAEIFCSQCEELKRRVAELEEIVRQFINPSFGVTS